MQQEVHCPTDKSDTSAETLYGRGRAIVLSAKVGSHLGRLELTLAPVLEAASLSPPLSFSSVPTLLLSSEFVRNLD